MCVHGAGAKEGFKSAIGREGNHPVEPPPPPYHMPGTEAVPPASCIGRPWGQCIGTGGPYGAVVPITPGTLLESTVHCLGC